MTTPRDKRPRHITLSGELPYSGRGYRIGYAAFQERQQELRGAAPKDSMLPHCKSGACEGGTKKCPTEDACRNPEPIAQGERGYFSDVRWVNRLLWTAFAIVITAAVVILIVVIRSPKP